MRPASACVAWLAVWAPAWASGNDCARELLDFRALHQQLRQADLTESNWRNLEAHAEALAACGQVEARALVAAWAALDAEGRATQRRVLHELWTRWEEIQTSTVTPDATSRLLADLALALDAARANQNAWLQAELLHLRCAVHLSQGDPARASADGEAASAQYARLGLSTQRRQLLPLYAEAQQNLGADERAAAMWRELTPQSPHELDAEPDAGRRAEVAEQTARALSALVELELQHGRLLDAQDVLWDGREWLAALMRHEHEQRTARTPWWWLLTDSVWRLRAAQVWIELAHDRAQDALASLQSLEAWCAELAHIAGSDGADARAVECVQRILQDRHALLGGALQRMGRLDEAARWYANAQEPQARVGQAELALLRGEPEQALSLATGVVGVPRVEAHAATVRGRALLALQRGQEAREQLEWALDQARTHTLDTPTSVAGEWIGVETVVQLARAHVDLGAPLEAAAVLATWQARELRPSTARISAADLQAWSACSELGLLVCAAGADSFVAVHVDRGGRARATTTSVPRRNLAQTIEAVSLAAQSGDEPLARLRASALESQLGLSGVPDALLSTLPVTQASDEGRLLVLACGILEQVPFDLLPSFAPTTGPRRVTTVLPGLWAARPSTQPRKPWNELAWTLLGDPYTTEGTPLYSGAKQELAQLSRLLDTPEARITRAQTLAVLSTERALHLATHVESRAAGPALLLDGSWLSCAELRAHLRPLPLVVLAACGTAQGLADEGAAQLSIAREFLHTGTPLVVATLWPVENSAAHAWSLAFHDALKAGRTPSRAASQARAQLQAQGYSCADWAAFRVLGHDTAPQQ